MIEPRPVLTVTDLKIIFEGPDGRPVPAVREVSFELRKGQTLALVGESGSGKTSLARGVAQLIRPASGGVVLHAEDEELDLTLLSGRRLRRARRTIQMVFQDPDACLDPRQRVGDAIAEPLRHLMPHLGARARRQRVASLLERVSLAPVFAGMFPHELSGGQRQRVGIARALAPAPQVIILDEPVSALDVSVRAQIINLLLELQQRSGVAYLYITHDLATVPALADEVAVMRDGIIVESGPARRILTQPEKAYTRELLAAVPTLRHTC